MPAVFHIPHASVVVPPEMRASLLLGDTELERELLVMTDRYTDELFASAGVEQVVFPVSRLVLDPERFLDDAAEPMTKQGMGVIYERSSTGGRLREAPTADERVALIDRYYKAHHDTLTNAVSMCLDRHGQCLVIDGHSFSSTPLPHEPDQAPDRPDICIGTDDFHTPAELAQRAAALLRDGGWRVEMNRPFAGALVPLNYYRQDACVSGLMIEVNRRLYMDEQTGAKLATFDDTRRTLSSVIERLFSGN